MGLMKRAAASATKIVNSPPKVGSRTAAGTTVAMNDKELADLMRGLPLAIHNKVLKKAVAAAAEIVKVEAQVQLSIRNSDDPNRTSFGDSAKTGTRKKWSGPTKLARMGTRQGDNMSDNVTVKKLPYKKGRPAVTIVGSDYYTNNYAHTHEPLAGKSPANIRLWGKKTGGPKGDGTYKLKKRPWLAPAGMMTSGLQMQAMKRVIKARMKNI